MKIQTCVTISLPSWIDDFIDSNELYLSDEDRMRFAVNLAEMNVQHKTGGPFGAAIFDVKTGKLVSVGVNCVVSSGCSVAHAEMMAIMLAQEATGGFRLAGGNGTAYVLATSAQPCAMCFGALSWSGVKKVVCGARSEDVEKIIGFDEGPLHPTWKNELTVRGIEVVVDVLRDDACKALRLYKDMGGTLY